MRNKWITALGGLLLALTTLVMPTLPTPSAAAAPAPWHWVRVRDYVHVDPYGYYSIREFCPSGYTAITGGLELPIHSRVRRGDEYRFDDGAGSSWFVTFENTSQFHGDAWVVAECVLTSDLPPMSHNFVQVPATGQYNTAGATVSCLNEGEVVLTGGASWSNVNTRTLSVNGAGPDGRSWHAEGSNSVKNALLAVEVYCVDPAAVPGYVKVEYHQPEEFSWQASVTCPTGKRVLHGGSPDSVFASYPNLNRWTATGSTDYVAYDAVVRAWCVDAGVPTVTSFSATPGPEGTLTSDVFAGFTMDATDPAGFAYPGFRCSLDNSAPTTCYEPWYEPLADGPHQFVVFPQTPDGRLGPTITYRWTIDSAAPTVTTPGLAKISLTTPTIAWKAADVGSGVETHQAKLWRARADGSVVDWSFPAGWDDLPGPRVKLPALAAGETQCVSVRATDLAGGSSAWSPPRCTSRPFDDRAIATTTASWTRLTGTTFWLETATQTSATGQRLRRPATTFAQVGVLATVCPGCGVVELALDGVKLARIALDKPAVAHQRVLLLPAGAVRTGTLTVTSVTTGKVVRIDGLITVRATTTPPPP
ncbi:hypothetical protein [Nocardioides stalactiti]|uniref:hypothetical protein n=1 Tax=Nocardioides stalactiti TaxID=2755356 RepID=UPI0015FFF8E4|nr:hypothetical protein [Nocardioides stalactiti]